MQTRSSRFSVQASASTIFGHSAIT
jgi:hypothetical protein